MIGFINYSPGDIVGSPKAKPPAKTGVLDPLLAQGNEYDMSSSCSKC